MISLDDIRALANSGLSERQLNRILLNELAARRMTEAVFLEYLELTQGDIKDLLSGVQFQNRHLTE